MIGPFWIWGVYRQWRCEKMLWDAFDAPMEPFSVRLWSMLTLRLFEGDLQVSSTTLRERQKAYFERNQALAEKQQREKAAQPPG